MYCDGASSGHVLCPGDIGEYCCQNLLSPLSRNGGSFLLFEDVKAVRIDTYEKRQADSREAAQVHCDHANAIRRHLNDWRLTTPFERLRWSWNYQLYKHVELDQPAAQRLIVAAGMIPIRSHRHLQQPTLSLVLLILAFARGRICGQNRTLVRSPRNRGPETSTFYSSP